MSPSNACRAGQESRATRYTITELANEFGVTARTLRHYEERGIVSPRRAGQKRLYSRRDRGRMRLALQGKRVGFSLAEICELLDLYDIKDGQETQMRNCLKRFRERVADLEAQRREIDGLIAELNQACGKAEAKLFSGNVGGSIVEPEPDPLPDSVLNSRGH